MARDDTLVLNDFEIPRSFRVRERRLKSGKVRRKVTIEIESEPIMMDMNHLRLGQLPAEAIKAELTADFNKMKDEASTATRAFRKRAADALNAGKRWAQKRYGGGRTGVKQPNVGIRKFIDSGRLKEGLHVRENVSDESWTINVPANRLNPDREWYGSKAAFWQMLDDLRRELPSLEPRELMKRKGFRRAIDKSIEHMIQVQKSMTQDKIARLRQLKFRTLRTAARLTLGV